MFSLLEFLFGTTSGKGHGSVSYQTSSNPNFKSLEDKIDKLQNQLNSLEERVIHLENRKNEKQGNLNILSEPKNIRFKSYSNTGQ